MFKKKGANVKLDAFFCSTPLKCTMTGEAFIVAKPQRSPRFFLPPTLLCGVYGFHDLKTTS